MKHADEKFAALLRTKTPAERAALLIRAAEIFVANNVRVWSPHQKIFVWRKRKTAASGDGNGKPEQVTKDRPDADVELGETTG